MNIKIREKLRQLKSLSKSDTSSNIPIWLRELIFKNTEKLLDSDASDQEVLDEMVGGLRAITDIYVPNDDEQIPSLMISIIAGGH